MFFCSISIFTPKSAQAVDWLVVREKIQYFFAFSADKKIEVLEKQAETRLDLAQDYADIGNHSKVQDSLQDYLQAKEKQDNFLDKVVDDHVLGVVQERTIEQQKTIEDIKTKVDQDTKQNIIQVQEQVVNQVAQRVVEVNGKEGQTEFFNKVEHVWAPGTGPGGGEAGVVYEGGAKIMFAPGTSAGGSGDAKADIKTVEIKTD